STARVGPKALIRPAVSMAGVDVSCIVVEGPIAARDRHGSRDMMTRRATARPAGQALQPAMVF
ncbi:MAG TPA: hypothetical protein VFK86_10525, partial [Bauldia sp.]|nr:hypothetical protein [Bauldia sp.]